MLGKFLIAGLKHPENFGHEDLRHRPLEPARVATCDRAESESVLGLPGPVPPQATPRLPSWRRRASSPWQAWHETGSTGITFVRVLVARVDQQAGVSDSTMS